MIQGGKFERFLKRHRVLTLATRGHVAHAFYACAGEGVLVFSASAETLHGQHLSIDPAAAWGVALESKIVARLQGVQARGSVRPATEAERAIYLRRFPFAALKELTLWAAVPEWMKLTDNTLGFGKKLIWTR